MELTHPNNTDVRSAYLHVAVERSHGVPDLLPDLLEVRIACGIGPDSSDERLQLAALQHARRLLDDTIASLAPRGVDEAIEHHKSPGDQGILSKLESIDMKSLPA
ncbi:hypothetical protein CRM94_16965 [Burkholderia gladioli]|uniref:Uncharacterized protein n=1 Tax=Burkholderia gladioli TaxID=28095 RepID=A0A2A7S9N5_BURGA|nr:hypothetical protein [Burkholderia gladioli]PEH40414.1 hypothetical protein CRM94_16965 [Burkholderia gladioli]